MIGTIIGEKYEITRQIGAGGMGSVFEATHTGTGRRVALKLIVTAELAKNPMLVARFQREAKAAGAIETEHIVQVLDTGTDGPSGLPYMVMEFLEGEDVQQLIRRVGPLPPDVALRIVAQACLGLQKAHDAHVVHRDVKSANLFVTKRDGGTRLVKLLDFGIAKVKMEQAQSAENAGLTRTGSMLGSPLYMSPEQARGQKTIDHRADLWSLGAVLYELLAGRTPFHHIEALGELIIAICADAPPPVQNFAPWAPPEVARIISRAMRIDPAQRYQTAKEMFDDCRAVLSGTALDETMMRGVTADERAVVASRHEASVSDGQPARVSLQPAPLADANASTVLAPATPAPASALTTAGSGAVAAPAPSPPAKASGLWAGVGVAAALAVGGGAWVAFGRPPPPPAPAATITTVVQVVQPPPEPPPAAPSAVATPAPTARTVSLVIRPKDATVEVDGTEVKLLDDGSCELSGPLGTARRVVVKKGKLSKDVSVIITDRGASPPAIELEGSGRSPTPLGPATARPTGAPAAPTAPAPISTSFVE
jgi:hypothetical protein